MFSEKFARFDINKTNLSVCLSVRLSNTVNHVNFCVT